MSKPFKGVVDIDVRDSTPDWEPYVGMACICEATTELHPWVTPGTFRSALC
jgi:hypothetical protein